MEWNAVFSDLCSPSTVGGVVNGSGKCKRERGRWAKTRPVTLGVAVAKIERRSNGLD